MPSPENATLSISKNQRRGIGAALAAWAVFLLLAGGLTGYVVVYSENPERSHETAGEKPSDQEDIAGEEREVAASEPSLAVAQESAKPPTDAEADDRQSEDMTAADGSSSDIGSKQQPPTPNEAAEKTAAAVADKSVQQAEAEGEAPVSDVMKPVAAKAEVTGQNLSEPNTGEQEPPAQSKLETPSIPAVPDQPAVEALEGDRPATADEAAAAPDPAQETTAATTAQGETQVAFRAPQPAPGTEDTPPWQRYAAYFLNEDTRPRVAIIMTGLGMSDGVTEAAIKSLPPEITLSFSPYARNLARWIGLARVNGHEVLLDLYMEPSTYPLDDPGPQAIMTVLSEEENRKRFNWVLSRGNSYVGLTGRLGSRLLTRRRSLSPVMEDIAEKGLLFVDDRATAGSLGFGIAQDLDIPAAYSEGLIDEPSANRAAIDAKLNRIERIALTKGAAVALAQPYPVTIERLNAWIEELSSRGVVLAPITAVVNRQPPMR